MYKNQVSSYSRWAAFLKFFSQKLKMFVFKLVYSILLACVWLMTRRYRGVVTSGRGVKGLGVVCLKRTCKSHEESCVWSFASSNFSICVWGSWSWFFVFSLVRAVSLGGIWLPTLWRAETGGYYLTFPLVGARLSAVSGFFLMSCSGGDWWRVGRVPFYCRGSLVFGFA